MGSRSVSCNLTQVNVVSCYLILLCVCVSLTDDNLIIACASHGSLVFSIVALPA